MKTIDVFRKSVEIIINSTPGLLQKNVAKKVNTTMAFEEHAISDFNDFLKGRKKYSLDKQEKVAEVLGYTYIDLLILGKKSLAPNEKIANFQKKQIQRKIMLRDGSSCTYATLLKMIEQIFLSNLEGFDIKKSRLIDCIIETWKEIEKIKKAV